MLEDGAFLGKSSLKGSPVRKFPPEYVIKSPPHVTNCKDDSEEPNHKMECSAENAVGKTSLSFVKSASQSLNYGPYMGNSQPVGTTDNTMGPWCFHQSPGPQWLVPVMSPSEGLVYKPMPYPGPELMGTVSGGYGPFGSAPMTCNFMNSAYGIPSPHHQGIGVLPGSSPVGHMYFPPYGMPVINPAMSVSTVEQVNPFVGPVPQSQTEPVSGGGVNSSMEQQSSCNVPTQKNASVPQGRKFHASKSSDLQGSTDISPAERVKGVVVHNSVEGPDPHPPFPVAPVVLEGATQSQDAIANQPTRAIKVVPHNRRSATESAARIFRFIQEERKQYDSV